MAKYKTIQELANGFIRGELESWVLMVDNDNTYLHWAGPVPDGIDEDDFYNQKSEEGEALWDSPDVYILDQALTAAGIPNKGV